MKPSRGRVVEVTSLPEFDRRVEAGADDLSGWRLAGLDLRERADALEGVATAGATFVECGLDEPQARRLRDSGALVLSRQTDVPVDLDRTTLYSAAELYDTEEYAASLDARAYAWSRDGDGLGSGEEARARALHDHAVDVALTAWVQPRRIVGVMGGHALRRGEPAYAEAARLGHLLGGPLTVATGGGPGAMEAANLGAALSSRPLAEVEAALEGLARAPGFRPSVDAWARAAFEVVSASGGSWSLTDSLGIPTWHYGHEPPNVFATVIAKYFRNATREAILLQVCDAGIVFLPGAAGTVQEVFQDACENYYADPSSLAPMVLVGRTYWTETLPVWPLLSALARGRAMEGRVHLVNDVEEAAALIRDGLGLPGHLGAGRDFPTGSKT